MIHNRRENLQFSSWYFVIQTFTTVGYGDFSAITFDERLFRIVCMIVGSCLYSLLTSHIIEHFIVETLNIYTKNDHEQMIDKMLRKQNMKGDAKRFLNLLGDSVQSEDLNNELVFAQLLPSNMSDTVLRQMWKVQ